VAVSEFTWNGVSTESSLWLIFWNRGFKYGDYDQKWFKNESLQILAYGYIGRLRYMILPS